MFQQTWDRFKDIEIGCLTYNDNEQLREELKSVKPDEINSAHDGEQFIDLLRKFRESIAKTDKLNGDNYPDLLKSLLSVGEDGLYSNKLRFIFELIQNVDDCDYDNINDCKLDIHFDFNKNTITLNYNEVGFTPFNVFAITGIAEAAKNLSSDKKEIGEKGIGFKSVFGVADKVWIRSGWFSFELNKDNFTIPVAKYEDEEYHNGTQMVLYVSHDVNHDANHDVKDIYEEIKNRYCKKDVIFSSNPILFLNKLTSLRMYFDGFRSMLFEVSGHPDIDLDGIHKEDKITISVNLKDYNSNGLEFNENNRVVCTRYTSNVLYSEKACKERYGEKTKVGENGGKKMSLQVFVPERKYLDDLKNGALYSFLPTQIKLSAPIVCDVPFKLDGSREFVDPQDNNLWFAESTQYLSELLDYVYLDWCKIIKEDIVFYLPNKGDSFFAPNNGKEKCLSNKAFFKCDHFLQKELFYSADGSFNTADDVFFFKKDENVIEPEKIHKFLNLTKKLFFMPDTKKTASCGIDVISDVYYKLFIKALSDENTTDEALDLLDRANYTYTKDTLKKVFEGDRSFVFSTKQIESIFSHESLAKIFIDYSCEKIKEKMRPKFSFAGQGETGLSKILYKDFRIYETPKLIENYFTYTKERYICVDIEESRFLPCCNGLVLSHANPLASVASFCYTMDQRDTFSVRIKLREVSERLNSITNDDSIGTPFEYIKELSEQRKIIRDSLEKDGYKRYIELILRSGTNKNRFIQELIQNADDCNYPPDITPTFSLSKKQNTIITKYNETGFTRENIRAITAIGESTKNRLLENDTKTIGEKGVGFKTIFSVASKVKISSGDYHFILTDSEPTIPKPIKKDESVNGTYMEITLKGDNPLVRNDAKELLKLCLCLRNLKRLDIYDHTIRIEDTETLRIIFIDNKPYKFKKLLHCFTLPESMVEEHNRTEYHQITNKQRIVCYISERKNDNGYIYNGLPTQHKMSVPISVDAPFELTTSREQIEEDKDVWNSYIRNEFYEALKELMILQRDEKRIEVLRYANFSTEFGSLGENRISDCNYINNYDLSSLLKQIKIIPTYNKDVFVASLDVNVRLFPQEIAHFLFSKGNFGKYLPETIIEYRGDSYKSVISALDLKIAEFKDVFPLIEEYAETYIDNSEFSELLFDYLQNATDEYYERIATLEIIPVYSLEYRRTQYLSYKEMHNELYVKEDAYVSDSNYYVLNERILSKAVCEKILGTNINEMNSELERSRYISSLEVIIDGNDINSIYLHLMKEYKNGNISRYKAFDVLKGKSEIIPLKNQLGEITNNELFVCNQPAGYFDVDMLKSITVAEECKKLAEQIGYKELKAIHYENVIWNEPLTEDDIECIQDDYFINSDEIFRGFYRDGLISSELWHKYNLDYLSIGRKSYLGDYEFPQDTVSDIERLRSFIDKQVKKPTEIVSVDRTVSVDVGQKPNGEQFELQIEDAREGALRIYNPDNSKEICFCQMCKTVKDNRLIEVNNILKKPKYFFRQLRVALCLECSTYFKAYRSNDSKREVFLQRLREADTSDKGIVEINLDDENTITFTATHLAEIQEILESGLF